MSAKIRKVSTHKYSVSQVLKSSLLTDSKCVSYSQCGLRTWMFTSGFQDKFLIRQAFHIIFFFILLILTCLKGRKRILRDGQTVHISRSSGWGREKRDPFLKMILSHSTTYYSVTVTSSLLQSWCAWSLSSQERNWKKSLVSVGVEELVKMGILRLRCATLQPLGCGHKQNIIYVSYIICIPWDFLTLCGTCRWLHVSSVEIWYHCTTF